jgi:hypothetical protein
VSAWCLVELARVPSFECLGMTFVCWLLRWLAIGISFRRFVYE